jgi:hypothetical protein
MSLEPPVVLNLDTTSDTFVDETAEAFYREFMGANDQPRDYVLICGELVSSLIKTKLHGIYISGPIDEAYRIDDKHISAIFSALRTIDIPLKDITFRYQKITDKGLAEIAEFVLSYGVLSLDLQGNDIEGTTLSELQLDSPELCPLEHLNISCNPLQPVFGMFLGDVLSSNGRLRSLAASSCGFKVSAVIAIATSLRDNRSLQQLILDRPLLDSSKEEETTEHISTTLEGPTAIRDFGARLLATSLSRCHSLNHLDLECNDIGVLGCEAIASHLITQSKTGIGAALETLLLSYNRVGEGAIALAEVNSTSLHHKSYSSLRIVPLIAYTAYYVVVYVIFLVVISVSSTFCHHCDRTPFQLGCQNTTSPISV